MASDATAGQEASLSAFEDALSFERFGRYLSWAADDRARAIDLYTLNARVSESLYIPLQMLEVALRNRVHLVMTELKGESWFQEDGVLLGEYQPEQLSSAIDELAKAGHTTPTPSRVVAALTFSFWTAMFGKSYEDLWQGGLHRIGARADGKGLRRKDFSGPLTRIRLLRNRIAHHEPVLHWDLHKTNSQLVEIIGWLAPVGAEWCAMHSRFASVWPTDLKLEST